MGAVQVQSRLVRHTEKLTPFESVVFLLTGGPGASGSKTGITNDSFNSHYLGKDGSGRFKPIVEDLRSPDGYGFYSSTWGFIGAKDMPLGKELVIRGIFQGREKLIHVPFDENVSALVNRLVMYDVTQNTQLVNPYGEGKGSLIRRYEEAHETDEFIMRFSDPKISDGISDRETWVPFERYGDQQIHIWVPKNAVGVPLRRDFYGLVRWHYVNLDADPSGRRWVAYEAADAIVAGDNAPL